MKLESQVVLARSRALLVEEVGDELVIYDIDRDEAHHLSASAAAVWRLCASATTVEYVVGQLVGYPEPQAIVWQALGQLQDANLLDTPILMPADHTMGRRRFLRNLGIAVIAAPVVTTIVAQTPASAACTGALQGTAGQACCSAGFCLAGRTCQTGAAGTKCCAANATSDTRGNTAGCPTGGSSASRDAFCCSGVCTSGACVGT